MAADPRIAAHLARAERRLRAAEALLGEGYNEDAVSRAYYAAFHAATAALLSLGIEAKTHGGLRTLFALHVVRPGLVPPEMGKALESLYDARRQSDYEVIMDLDEDSAMAAIAAARGLLATCRTLSTAP